MDMERMTEKILVSKKMATLVVLLSNIEDRLCELKAEMGEIRTDLGQIQTKTLCTTKPLLDKEDYE